MDPAHLKRLFLDEARIHLDEAFEQLDALGATENPAVALGALLRNAHSLKGMAATMGYAPMVALAHALEDRFEAMRDRAERPGEGLDAACRDALALLSAMLDEAVDGAPRERPQVAEVVATLRGAIADRPSGPALPGAGRESRAPSESTTSPAELWHVIVPLDPADAPRDAVRAIARLGELGALRTVHPPRVGGSPTRPRFRMEVTLATPAGTVGLEILLRRDFPGATAREAPAAPTAPASAPARRAGEWCRVRSADLDRAFADVRDWLRPGEAHRTVVAPRAQAAARRLFDTLREMRLIEFSEIAGSLRATAHAAGREAGKQVRLEVRGGGRRLDRAGLEALLPCLQHLVRNAVAHGIEDPDARRRSGKPATGTVRVEIARHGRRWRLTVRDDGRGITDDVLRRTAVRTGGLDRRQAAALGRSELHELVFRSGFSSRGAADTLAGRGVGLDAVRHAIDAMGGRVSWTSTPGVSTEFVCEFPQQAAMLETLVVRSGEALYALPLEAIERVERSAGTDDEGERPAAPRLAVRTRGDGPTITIDEIVGRRELLTQPIGPPLSYRSHHDLVATLDDGRVVLVVDPARLDGTGPLESGARLA